MLSRFRVPKSLFLALVALLVGAAVTIAAGAPNGGFERGNFAKWDRNSQGGGQWNIYSGSQLPESPRSGEFAARVTQLGPGSNLLMRRLRLRENRRHKLSAYVSYNNTAEDFASPNTIQDPSGGGSENQQLRVDVIRKSAPIRSLDGDDVLATLLRTRAGDDRVRGWFKVGARLNRFAGRTVVLRIAEVDNQSNFYVAVDDLKVRSRRR